ncbi:MAG: hypothetical protein ABWY90_06230, partial [Solirubrobacterales bacterium]
ALVDVADDRAVAAPLDVQLSNLESGSVARCLARGPLAFEYRDAGLTRVNGDENSLLQLDHLKTELSPASR